MKKRFRALLLAAGLGTRLRPYTNQTPKCLMKIGNKPLLEHWLIKLEESECEAVLINTHYLSNQVEDFLDARKTTNLKIETIYEKELLGTAGTLKANRNFFAGYNGVLIHADNFTNLKLNNLIYAHTNRCKNTFFTMVTFKSDNPSRCGIVELNKDNILIDFHEKVKNPPGFIANGAIYAFDNIFLNQLVNLEEVSDFSCDVIPRYKGKIQTWLTNDILIDIGSPDSLEKAQKLFSMN